MKYLLTYTKPLTYTVNKGGDIVNLIREKRLKLGWTQEQFGKILGYDKGVGRTMICAFEKGQKHVPRNKLIQVSMLLSIPIEDLLKEEKAQEE